MYAALEDTYYVGKRTAKLKWDWAGHVPFTHRDGLTQSPDGCRKTVSDDQEDQEGDSGMTWTHMYNGLA